MLDARATAQTVLRCGHAGGGTRHVLQVYRRTEVLIDAAAEFLAVGLAVGESILVVASADHRADIEAHLVERGLDVKSARARGRIGFIDAETLLSHFMSGTKLDPERFHRTMETACEGLSDEDGRGVRVYGEMVDVLLGTGNHPAGLALEAEWNAFLHARPRVSLLCACALAHFEEARSTPAFVRVCDEHPVVLPADGFPAADAGSHVQLRSLALLQQRAEVGEREAALREAAEQALVARQGHQREAEDRFRLMADHAPVMLWLSEVDTTCSFFNEGWLRFTGRTMEQEQGNGWADGVHPDDLDRCLSTYMDAFEKRECFAMEYRLRRADGDYRWIFDQGAPRFAAGGVFAGYVGSAFDVTERLEARKALSESADVLRRNEDQLRRILDAAPDGIVTVDERARVLAINAAGMAMLRCAATEVEGAPVSRWVPGDWWNTPPASEHPEPHVREVVCVRSDGSTFPAEISASRLEWASHDMTVVIIRDCSNLRRLEREILETSEAIRRRFGQDLHDDLGQVLTGIAFLAQGLMDDVPPKLKGRVARLTSLVNGAIPRVRKIAEGLAPDLGQGTSLEKRLADLAEATTSTFKVTCTVQAGGDFSGLDSEMGLQLFLIAQEAVTNAVRHSGCTQIEIALTREGRRHALSVKDDGKGFSRPPESSGLGLRSMEYRARMLRGQLELRTVTTGGSEVRCIW